MIRGIRDHRVWSWFLQISYPHEEYIDAAPFPHWHYGWPTLPLDYYDFQGWVLTLKDGTQYLVEREDMVSYEMDLENNAGGTGFFVQAYGEARLKKITDRNGNSVGFGSGGITNFNASGKVGITEEYASKDHMHRSLPEVIQVDTKADTKRVEIGIVE